MTAIAGVRVSDLAKELKKTPAEMMADLVDLGVKASGPNAMVDLETANMVREMLGSKPMASAKIAEVGPNPTVQDIAEAIGISANVAVRKLMEFNELVAPRQRIKPDLATRLAAAFGFTLAPKSAPKPVAAAAVVTAPGKATGGKPGIKHKAPSGAMQPRPPVVTIMGHVDHGKTSLLDMIRKTKVVDGEFGGITQHIGAYQVEIEHNGEMRKITFLDTPGHAAFTEMRARGASVTDIVILVVAADDGIMPQTVEAINHAVAAKVPIIVAMNKMDKPEAKPDRIKQQLTEHNLVVEDYGGEVISVSVSAKTGDGINDLLEYILLVADVQLNNELKADPSGHATGAIIEAKVLPGRGPVATVLVQSGTLRIGDNLVAGSTYGKVRAMTNERGERLLKASPATPVEVSGLNQAPAAGDHVEVVKNEKDSRVLAEQRSTKERDTRINASGKRLTLADLSRQTMVIKDLNLIVKGDVQGSVEAVVGQLHKLEENKKDEEVRLSIKYSAVGNITEADVQYAETTASMIVGFNVRPDVTATKAAERDGVDIRLYNIIYDLTADIDKAMKGLLTPISQEFALGTAEVRQRFQTPKGIVIAGCFVTDGKLVRGSDVRVRRGRDIVFTGKIDTLRRIKDDAREVVQGYECGVVLHEFLDVQVGDIFECFEIRLIPRY